MKKSEFAPRWHITNVRERYLMKGTVPPTRTPCIAPLGISNSCWLLYRSPNVMMYLYPSMWAKRRPLGAQPNLATDH